MKHDVFLSVMFDSLVYTSKCITFFEVCSFCTLIRFSICLRKYFILKTDFILKIKMMKS